MHIDELKRQTAYPLSWPIGWRRTEAHKRRRWLGGGRSRHTVSSATWDVLAELRRLESSDSIISTNVELRRDGLPYSNAPAPTDPGVAVYFTLGAGQRVLACDAWDSVAHNLHAVALHIAALRGQDRWGVGSVAQAFAGYAALPEKVETTCWQRLGLDDPARRGVADIKRAFGEAVRRAHPDHGGTGAEIPGLIAARDEALLQQEVSG
jgi:hypothetical protein